MEKRINKTGYILLIFAVCMIFGGLMGIFHNYYAEWDLSNHRLFNGWSFLNNRLGIDLLPVYFRTTHNPYLDGITFLLMEKLNNHPYIFLFISGLKYGLFLFLSFLFYDLIFNKENKYRPFLIFSSMVLTAFSFLVLLTKSYSHTDMQPACILLISLFIYFKTVFSERTFKNSLLLFLASVLIGIAITLKYYNVVFCFGLILSTIFFHKSVKNPLKTILLIISGSLLGFLTTSAPWFYLTYTQYHNPIYPYFEAFFNPNTGIMSDTLVRDFEHLRPQNLYHFLFYPFHSTINVCTGLENGYIELKLPLGFSAVIIFLFFKFKENFETHLEKIANPTLIYYVICFTLITFYSNLLIFGSFRYILYVFVFWNLLIVLVYYLFLSLFDIQKYKFRLWYLILPIWLLVWYAQLRYNLFPLAHNFRFIISGLVLAVAVPLYIKEKDNFGKFLYAGLTYIVIFSVIMSYYRTSDIYLIPNTRQIMAVQDIEIEDRANVILGTNLTSFIAPFQNPNVRYIGFAIPLDYEKHGSYTFKNNYFKNSFLEQKLEEIFAEEDKALYFVFTPRGNGVEKKDTVYKNSVRYYSHNQITEFTDCQEIANKILFKKFDNTVIICKLK